MSKDKSGAPAHEEVTLSEARIMIRALAATQSILLLSAPGIGKSEMVQSVAAEAGLPCRSLLGTQIAPEDVSGVPRIIGSRSEFCPPRLLLPDPLEPYCLFLDELPAAAADVQKAFYSLLLERRVGEHKLPPGTWVVAAGNRMEDRAIVRAMSSALVNRVFILNVRADVKEWLDWAQDNGVHPDVIAFISFMPDALMREVPAAPGPFSTPRAWTRLSIALKQLEADRIVTRTLVRALVHGRVSPTDAAMFCAMLEARLGDLRPPQDYVRQPRAAAQGPDGLLVRAVRDPQAGAAQGAEGDPDGDQSLPDGADAGVALRPVHRPRPALGPARRRQGVDEGVEGGAPGYDRDRWQQ